MVLPRPAVIQVLPGGVVDVAVENVEGFLEVLVPVRELEPAAGWEPRIAHGELPAAGRRAGLDGRAGGPEVQGLALAGPQHYPPQCWPLMAKRLPPRRSWEWRQ